MLLASASHIELWRYVVSSENVVSWSKVDRMSRTQQCCLTAHSLTSHNPGKPIKNGILFHTSSHPFAPESLSVPDLLLRWRKCGTGGIAPTVTRADMNQSAEVETGESNEQVLKQTDESRDRRLGKETEKISDPLFNEHADFLVSSQGQTSKSRRKNTQHLSAFLFPPLCVSCRANTPARSLNNPRGLGSLSVKHFFTWKENTIIFAHFPSIFFVP